jgi:hypothetical protein
MPIEIAVNIRNISQMVSGPERKALRGESFTSDSVGRPRCLGFLVDLMLI